MFEGYLKTKREDAEIMIFGLPYEGLVNSRPGAIGGPQAIREGSECVESYSPFWQKDLLTLKLYDDGDIPVEGKGKATLESMAAAIVKRLGKGIHPVFLGGDHTVSFSVVRALTTLGHKFHIVHLDAHPDSQEAFEGDPWSYACWLRRSKELIAGNIYQLGIRTCTREEIEYSYKNHKVYLANQFVEGIRTIAEETKGENVYVSFDIDALDPSMAPGTSNPVYGGLMYDHIQALFHGLRGSKVIGFDVVEVAPNLDPTGRTAILAGEIVRDAILAWWA